MNSYQCNVCQHIYDPREGDPIRGVESGVSFNDLPEDWKCPVCGVGKESFHEIVGSGELELENQ